MRIGAGENLRETHIFLSFFAKDVFFIEVEKQCDCQWFPKCVALKFEVMTDTLVCAPQIYFLGIQEDYPLGLLLSEIGTVWLDVGWSFLPTLAMKTPGQASTFPSQGGFQGFSKMETLKNGSHCLSVKKIHRTCLIGYRQELILFHVVNQSSILIVTTT